MLCPSADEYFCSLEPSTAGNPCCMEGTTPAGGSTVLYCTAIIPLLFPTAFCVVLRPTQAHTAFITYQPSPTVASTPPCKPLKDCTATLLRQHCHDVCQIP